MEDLKLKQLGIVSSNCVMRQRPLIEDFISQFCSQSGVLEIKITSTIAQSGDPTKCLQILVYTLR